MQNKTIVSVALAAGYGLAVAATHQVSENPNLLSLPWLQVAVGGVISSWGGATATLGRYLNTKYTGASFHLRLEVVKDLFVSVTVGAGSYFAGAFYRVDSSVLALVLLLGGYLGVRLLSTVADKLLDFVRRQPVGS